MLVGVLESEILCEEYFRAFSPCGCDDEDASEIANRFAHFVSFINILKIYNIHNSNGVCLGCLWLKAKLW